MASKAFIEMDSVGIWARILFVEFASGRDHAYCIYAPTGKTLLAYDDTGTTELPTSSRDLKDVLQALGKMTAPVKSGHFIE